MAFLEQMTDREMRAVAQLSIDADGKEFLSLIERSLSAVQKRGASTIPEHAVRWNQGAEQLMGEILDAVANAVSKMRGR